MTQLTTTQGISETIEKRLNTLSLIGFVSVRKSFRHTICTPDVNRYIYDTLSNKGIKTTLNQPVNFFLLLEMSLRKQS